MLLGKVKVTIEDLAFLNRASRESDAVRRRGCIEHAMEKEGEILLSKQRTFFK
jgi:hypothetical protein